MKKHKVKSKPTWVGEPLYTDQNKHQFYASFKRGEDVFSVGDYVVLSPSGGSNELIGQIIGLSSRNEDDMFISCYRCYTAKDSAVANIMQKHDDPKELVLSDDMIEQQLDKVKKKVYVVSHEQYATKAYPSKNIPPEDLYYSIFRYRAKLANTNSNTKSDNNTNANNHNISNDKDIIEDNHDIDLNGQATGCLIPLDEERQKSNHYYVDNAIARTKNKDGKCMYFIKWVNHAQTATWSLQDQLMNHYSNLINNFNDSNTKFSLKLNMADLRKYRQENKKQGMKKRKQTRSSVWDLENYVSPFSAMSSAWKKSAEEAKDIEVPAWRDLEAQAQAHKNNVHISNDIKKNTRGPMSIENIAHLSDNEESSSEDTSDDFYNKLHNATNKLIHKRLTQLGHINADKKTKLRMVYNNLRNGQTGYSDVDNDCDDNSQ